MEELRGQTPKKAALDIDGALELINEIDNALWSENTEELFKDIDLMEPVQPLRVPTHNTQASADFRSYLAAHPSISFVSDVLASLSKNKRIAKDPRELLLLVEHAQKMYDGTCLVRTRDSQGEPVLWATIHPEVLARFFPEGKSLQGQFMHVSNVPYPNHASCRLLMRSSLTEIGMPWSQSEMSLALLNKPCE